MDVVTCYNLLYNASLTVYKGAQQRPVSGGHNQHHQQHGPRFVPLKLLLEAGLTLVWKKYGVQGRADRLFLDEMKDIFSAGAPAE